MKIRASFQILFFIFFYISTLLSPSFCYSQIIENDQNSQRASDQSDQSGWFPKPLDVINDIFEIFDFGVSEISKNYEHLDYNEWLELIESGRVQFNHELGKIEYTLIDGEPVIRIVHYETGTAFLLLDSTKINKNSDHLKQYLARQHLFSGANGQGSTRGRDAVLLWFQPKVQDPSTLVSFNMDKAVGAADRIVDINYSPKPITTMSKLKEYWQGIYKKPTRDTVAFGLGAAILQTAMGLGVSALKVAIDPSAPFLMEPAMLNFLFGAVIGTYSSTYRNWVYESNSSMMAATLKGSAVSAAYAFSLVYLTNDGFSSLTIMDAAGIMLYAKIASNILLNNWGKQEWTQWARVKTMERVDNKVYEINVPKLKEPIKVKQRDINYQIYAYLPPLFLRTADLIGISLSLPYLGFPLPLGSLALWASIPIVKYTTLKWAEKTYPESAKKLQLREKWNAFKQFPIQAPARFYQQTLKIIQLTPEVMSNIWQTIRNQAPILSKDVEVTEQDLKESKKRWQETWSKIKPADIHSYRSNRCVALFAN